MRDMRIAILGAGGTGVCAALELAGRGYFVDLYDENSQAITRASQNNEGKVHLGLVYAKDRTLNSAKTMILGAVHFKAYLERWIDFNSDRIMISEPFYYGVHKGTMTSTDALARHYDCCKGLLEDACAANGLSYLGEDKTLLAERLPARKMEQLVSSDYFLSVFRTSERAVDPRPLGALLRAAVRANPRIRFIGNARVTGVARAGSGGLRVCFRLNGDDLTENYDHVANTLWHGRLEIDATLGLAPERDWIYRYKMGGWLNTPIEPEAIPSLTIVLGPYGDLVNYRHKGLYLSWYPIGLIGTSRALKPPDWDAMVPAPRRQSILRQSYDALLKRCPLLQSIEPDEDVLDPCGGMIFAWGTTDIDDGDSALHTRYEIGIHSVGNYHSVNTGKYTMTPYLGFKTAERILGIS
jgi:hypothetical protein